MRVSGVQSASRRSAAFRELLSALLSFLFWIFRFRFISFFIFSFQFRFSFHNFFVFVLAFVNENHTATEHHQPILQSI